jgi:hypothetical protein
MMNKIVIDRQVPTAMTPWPENQADSGQESCGATIVDEGVEWICTRAAGHEQARSRVHAAHYESDTGQSTIGVSWVEVPV